MYTEQRPKGLPLTENERNLIAYLLKKGYNQTAIAKELGVWPSTICREIKRGQVEQLNGSTWEYYSIYSPQKAQGRAEYMRTAHGPDLKVSNRFDYLAALESWMLSGSSPEDAIHQVGNDYGITISKTTCYRYIEMKLFSTLRFKHLPQGHPKTGKSESLLVISERKTRAEIILKAESKTSAETVRQLRRLRRYFGSDWKLIFHTLTSDNGSEFADQAAIDGLGVTMFYCHPQSPHERGTNEVNNKLIRRKFPKGQSLSRVTQTQATQVQHWVNNYSRPMFGGSSAADMLKAEFEKLPLNDRAKVYRFFGLT